MYQNTEPAAYWRAQLMDWGPRVLLAILILVATRVCSCCCCSTTAAAALGRRCPSSAFVLIIF